MQTKAVLGVSLGWLLAASACAGTGGNEGPAFDAAGNYTLTYERISRSDTCANRDLDWTNGILQLTQSGHDITLDFGGGQQVGGSIDGVGAFSALGVVDDGGESVTLSLIGIVSETTIEVDDDLSDEEMVGDYEFDSDPEPDCRIRGRIAGPRSS